MACALKLSSFKSDPRCLEMCTWECGCKAVWDPACSVHAMCCLVDTQVHRLNFELHQVRPATFTLVSQLCFHSAHLQQLTVDVEPSNVTGHFMQRSGAKHLARLDCDFAKARHSS